MEQNAEATQDLIQPDQTQEVQPQPEVGQAPAPKVEEPQVELDWKVEHGKLTERLKKEEGDKKALTGQLNKLTREAERLDRIEGSVTRMSQVMEAFVKHQAAGTVDELPQEVAQITQRYTQQSLEQRAVTTVNEVYADFLEVAREFELDPNTAPELEDAKVLYNMGHANKDIAMLERARARLFKTARELDRNRTKEQTVESKKAAGTLPGTATARSMASGKLSGAPLHERIAAGKGSPEEQKRFIEEMGLEKFVNR